MTETATAPPLSNEIVTLSSIVDKLRPNLQDYESLYKTIHANPELSHQESETAALIQRHLAYLGDEFDIRANIGGHGLISILRNGPGRTLLLRADMDALPVKEKTGLKYSSRRRKVDSHGKETDVMHGQWHPSHDLHSGFP